MDADIERQIEIAAPAARVWQVMTDVDRWPDWTASVSRVERVDNTPLTIGSKVRISQPRLSTAVWTVTALEHERYLEWQAPVPGLHSVGMHRIEPLTGESVRVTLAIRWSGVLAPVIRLLFGRLSRRYVEMEAQGLKRRSEQGG